jgi:uncharacterized protein YijF (DUF1287 family)
MHVTSAAQAAGYLRSSGTTLTFDPATRALRTNNKDVVRGQGNCHVHVQP